MKTCKVKFILGAVVAIGLMAFSVRADDNPTPLPFSKFLELATANDTEFEQILVDELALQYQKDLRLPAKDIVLSVKQQHEFYFDQDRQSPDTTVGLSKLFPMTGTQLDLDYQAGATVSSSNKSSELSFALAQPIAHNAFGYSTRLLDKIIGLEVEVASHQVVEAYEDYLAAIITAYYTWYEDYQNYLIAQRSYEQNLKLLENMNERQKQKIALPIDVNKVQLQVLSRKERLIEFEEQYKNSSNVIQRIIRARHDMSYVPENPNVMAQLKRQFIDLFKAFTDLSRTFDILESLEKKSGLSVAREANHLLPSIDIIAGYEISGSDYDIKNEENFFYAGVNIDWPFPDQVDRAEFEVSKIEATKQKLDNLNTYHRLYTQMFNLYLQIEREKKLISVAEERITLATAILKDEEENYSFGKVTLNDYIQAFNDLDNNRFNQIEHDVQYKKLIVEWLRLSDQLVQKQELTSRIKSLQ